MKNINENKIKIKINQKTYIFLKYLSFIHKRKNKLFNTYFKLLRTKHGLLFSSH